MNASLKFLTNWSLANFTPFVLNMCCGPSVKRPFSKNLVVSQTQSPERMPTKAKTSNSKKTNSETVLGSLNWPEMLRHLTVISAACEIFAR